MMHTKTMEGLIGASTNMTMVNVPMRVYKEAELRGDTETMKRSMGYVTEFQGKAQTYAEQADEGTKEDAKVAQEEAKAAREEAIQKRKEERKELQERITENRDENVYVNTNVDTDADTVEVSEDGKILLKNHTDLTAANTDIEKGAVTYTKTGEVSQSEQKAELSISV